MTELTLRSIRPAQSREVASLSARVLTSFVIAFAGLLTLAPFVVYFSEH
jgi:hypothetical protein